MTEPNPHAERANKQAFVKGGTWRVRTFGVGSSKWGFSISASSQNVFAALVESIWVWLWETRPMQWVMNYVPGGYTIWSKVLIWCDGEEVAFLEVTEDQVRSFYPDEASFLEDWGWHVEDEDDWDGTREDL